MRPLLPLLLVLASLPACRERTPADRSPGPLGFTSDRAHESRVVVRGEATVRRTPGCAGETAACLANGELERAVDAEIAALGTERDARGEHLFLGRAVRHTNLLEVRAAGPHELRASYEVRLTSYARDAEHPAAPWIFPSTGSVEITDPARAALTQQLPRLQGEDGVLRVTLVLGQMSRGDLSANDLGLWSAEEARRSLLARGFVETSAGVEKPGASVRIIDPWKAPLASRSAAREIANALATSDLVYVNGHARSRLFAATDPALGRQARARLLFVDSCWGYALEAGRLHELLPQTSLIVTDGRTTTGSVAVVPLLLEALERGSTWGAFLRSANDAAEKRAASRSTESDPRFRVVEVYGLIPARAAQTPFISAHR